MRSGTLSGGLLIGAVVLLGYALRDQPIVARLLEGFQAREAAPAAGRGARKCSGGGRVVYTNEACPPGLREEPVGGAISVLPPPTGPASSRSMPTRGERLNEAITR